jgi:dephospho-CoA kinase
LNRARLSQLAFKEGCLEDLNAIVHPAVIEAQQRWMDEVFAHDPAAVAVIESALIFEVARDARARGEKEGLLADWRRRIDRIVVVTAPDALKIARFAARVSPLAAGREAAEAEGRRRLSHQIPDTEKAEQADYVIENSGDKEELRAKVAALWQKLRADSNISRNQLSLK